MLLDELIEMPRIRSAVDLEEILSPSTLCKAFNRFDIAVWRVLINLSVTPLPLTVSSKSMPPASTAVTPRNTTQSERATQKNCFV